MWFAPFLPTTMQNKATSSRGESPFFNLMENAEEIRIRELSGENQEKFTHSIEKVLKDFDAIDHAQEHAFVVYIKTPAPTPEPEPIAPPAPETIPREFLLENAQLLISGSDHLLARNIYSFLLKKDIRDLAALKGLGICFLKLGEAQSAKKCFRALHELYKMEEALVWLGFCSIADGEEKIASRYFLQVTSAQNLPEELRFEYFKERGNAHTRLGIYDDAFRSYSEALKIRPESDTVFVNLGTLELQRKRFESAHSHFSKATHLNSRNAKAFCGMGLVAIELGQTVFAKQQFERTLELDSQHSVALQQLIKLSEADGNFSAMKQRLNLYLLKDPKNDEFRYWLASCLIKEGSLRAAEKEIDQVLADSPNHERARKLKEEIISIAMNPGALR